MIGIVVKSMCIFSFNRDNYRKRQSITQDGDDSYESGPLVLPMQRRNESPVSPEMGCKSPKGKNAPFSLRLP